MHREDSTVATLRDEKQDFPHIEFRTQERREAYLPGTGLTVWEVAWIAEAYEGDVEQTAEHLGIDRSLVRAALDYASQHVVEIGMQIHDHVCWEEEDFLRAFPQATVIRFDPETGKLTRA